MNRAYLTTLFISLSALHCGVKSTYTPANPAAREIVWNFDGGLEAVRNGEVVASQPGFTGLTDAVACVPEAASEARDASRANVFGWTFLSTGLAATFGGSGMMIAAIDEDHRDLFLPGAATIGGGLVGTIIGAVILGSVLPNAVDAVNIYNDSYQSRAECLTAR